MHSKLKIEKYSYRPRINLRQLVNEAKDRLSMGREPFYCFTVLRNHPFLRSFYSYVQGHPMDLFLKLCVLQANFCLLGDVEKIISPWKKTVARRKIIQVV